jgi:hypothetical protein
VAGAGRVAGAVRPVRDRVLGHERPGRGITERRQLGRRHPVRPDEKQLRPPVRARPAGGPAPPRPDPGTAAVDRQRPAQGSRNLPDSGTLPARRPGRPARTKTGPWPPADLPPWPNSHARRRIRQSRRRTPRARRRLWARGDRAEASAIHAGVPSSGRLGWPPCCRAPAKNLLQAADCAATIAQTGSQPPRRPSLIWSTR